MAALMNVPVLGIIENMSYYICPDCGARHSIYGESHIDGIAAKHGIPVTARLPIDPKFAEHATKAQLSCLKITRSIKLRTRLRNYEQKRNSRSAF